MKFQNIDKIMPALTLAQLAIGGITKDSKNNHLNSTYANINAVLNGIRIPLVDNGLHLSQPIEMLDDGTTVIRTILFHNSGQYLESCIPISMNEKPQDVGKLITYYRRYAIMSLMGLPSEDDDANSAQRAARYEEVAATIKQVAPPKHITIEQWDTLDKELIGFDELRTNLQNHCKLSNLKDVTLEQYTRGLSYAENWKKLPISKTDSKK